MSFLAKAAPCLQVGAKADDSGEGGWCILGPHDLYLQGDGSPVPQLLLLFPDMHEGAAQQRAQDVGSGARSLDSLPLCCLTLGKFLDLCASVSSFIK